MKLRVYQILIAVIAVLATSLPHAPVFAATSGLTINVSQTYQRIDGMGANINVNSWEDGLVKPAIDALIETNGSYIFRVNRDPQDWVSSESLIPDLHNLDLATLQQEIGRAHV